MFGGKPPGLTGHTFWDFASVLGAFNDPSQRGRRGPITALESLKRELSQSAAWTDRDCLIC